jgi:uncharacterized paraquat-inducible protein A
MARITQGKCRRCQVGFRWPSPPLLRDAYCPKCGRKLSATTYLFRGPWLNVGSENVQS